MTLENILKLNDLDLIKSEFDKLFVSWDKKASERCQNMKCDHVDCAQCPIYFIRNELDCYIRNNKTVRAIRAMKMIHPEEYITIKNAINDWRMMIYHDETSKLREMIEEVSAGLE